MLQKYFFCVFISLLICLPVTHAEGFGKYSVDKTTTCTNHPLSLNGAGIRKKLFIKLYIAALYVDRKINDVDKLMQLDQPLCMRLHIVSSKITAKKMIKATHEGFVNSTRGDTSSIAKEIETFLNWLKQPINKGDVFEFSFTPQNTITILKNDVRLGKITNQKFASALFGIWLGDNPVQTDLKNKLLGK